MAEGAEEFVEEGGDGGFAVGAGDTDEGEVSRRLSEPTRGEES